MLLRCFLLLLLGCTVFTEVLAQQNRLLMVDDWTYGYITRLQHRGHLLDLNPTAPPYRQGEVWAALEKIDRDDLNRTEQHWLDLLTQVLQPVETDEHEIVIGGDVEGGGRAINSDRLDTLRPLGDTLQVFVYLTPHAYLDAGPFIAQVGWREDMYYDQDPDGLDTALRLLARSEDTYAGYHHRYFSAYLGRWNNQWGVPGEAAALISDNPRSQDQVYWRIGGQRLSVTGLLSELDSITEDGRFTGRAVDTGEFTDSKRRYLAAHRWDWRPSRHFMISAMEAAIYSGKNAGVSLKYLNPLHTFTFVIDNIPKNDENNGFIAGLVWGQYKRLTMHGQWMVDDFDVLGEGNEPLAFSLVGSLTYAAPAFDVGATLEMISARTYNAPQPEGKHLYLLRGLATQFSDYIHAAAFADVYLDGLVPGLRLTPRIDVLAQGEQDIRRPYPTTRAESAPILDGTVERTVRPAVQMYLQPAPWWWIRLDGGVNVVSNVDHVADQQNTRFVGLAEVGVRLSLDRAYRISF